MGRILLEFYKWYRPRECHQQYWVAIQVAGKKVRDRIVFDLIQLASFSLIHPSDRYLLSCYHVSSAMSGFEIQ